MKKLFISVCFFGTVVQAAAQHVGIGISAPTEKLQVDSGHIKIGSLLFNPLRPSLLKFGDGDYLTMGEEEDDDKLTIRAKELYIRPSGTYSGVPVSIQGSSNYSHFYFGGNEDTYIRGGQSLSQVIIGDGGGLTGIGMYPVRAGLEQDGTVGNTAAIFGSNGAGVSLQKNYPAIGFNQYSDGTNSRTLGTGYAAQLGLDETDGTLVLKSWQTFGLIPGALLSAASTQRRLLINRFGKMRIGSVASAFPADPGMPDLYIAQSTGTSSSGYARSNGLSLGYSGSSINDNSSVNLSIGDLTDGPVWQNALKIFAFQTGGPVAMIHPNTGQYLQLSDGILKKDTRVLGEEVLSKLMQLKPYTYLMSNDTRDAKLKYGFISQEVEKVFPDMVFQAGDYKMLNYESFLPVAIKAIQVQQAEIEDLKKELAEIKTKLNR